MLFAIDTESILYQYTEHLFHLIGIKDMHESWVLFLIIIVWIVLLIAVFMLSHKIIKLFFFRIVRITTTQVDDQLITNKLLYLLSHIPFIIALYFTSPIILDTLSLDIKNLLFPLLNIYTVVLAILIIRCFFGSLRDYLKTISYYKDKPLDSYLQIFMIVVWIVGGLFIFSFLTGKDIGTFLATLGALSAVLLLIFKDTLMGFVASIQIAAGDLVRIGDWITMEKYGADGDVIAINLSTVKIQNFDMTITTIPTYHLISDSFKNWRGMSDSQGRRIKRNILIKASSVRYVDEKEILTLTQIDLMKSAVLKKREEIERHNKEHKINQKIPINGRRMTNLGLFRLYIENYLKQHPNINQDMTIMCRHLPPTSQGIPLELYAFSSQKKWELYEQIMADIFDHAFASIPVFYLEAFELPSNLSAYKN